MAWDNEFDVRVHRNPLDRVGLVSVVLWETRRDLLARWGNAGPMPPCRVVTGFEEEDSPEGSHVEPSFTISDEVAQRLMDRLFEMGFRPSGAAGTAGQLAAIQGHLTDMRILVAKTLDVALP